MTEWKALCAELVTCLQWYVQEDDTIRGDTTSDGGKNWDEINAYWIEGQDKALATLERAQAALSQSGPECLSDEEMLIREITNELNPKSKENFND